jgi:hypothetical protein
MQHDCAVFSPRICIVQFFSETDRCTKKTQDIFFHRNVISFLLKNIRPKFFLTFWPEKTPDLKKLGHVTPHKNRHNHVRICEIIFNFYLKKFNLNMLFFTLKYMDVAASG